MKFSHGDREFEFDENRLTFAEARAVERVTGITMAEAMDAASKGSALAMQAYMWIAMKRADPPLKFSDLDDMSLADFAFTTDEPEAEPEPDPTPVADAATSTPND